LFVLIFEELTAVVGLPGEEDKIDPMSGEVNGELFARKVA